MMGNIWAHQEAVSYLVPIPPVVADLRSLLGLYAANRSDGYLVPTSLKKKKNL